MTAYWSLGQLSEIIQYCHVPSLGHLENWVLYFKRETFIAKNGIFVKPISEYTFENTEPLSGLNQT